MTDYVGIAEAMPVTDLPIFMSEYYETQGRAISASSGAISLLIGDNIMAVWDQPNSAQLACESALAQSDAMKKFGEWAKAHGYPSPAFRIGINTGMMLIQRGPAPRDLRVLGDAVNTAARLEQLNKEYGTQFLMSEATLAGLAPSMIVRPADVVRIIGKENTVKLFELIGIAKEVDTEQSKFLDKFRAAFANYESANFKEALDLFEAVQNHMPADALTGLYISRCRQLMKLAPDESWNGVMTFRVE